MKINKAFLSVIALLIIVFGFVACVDTQPEVVEPVEEDTTIITPTEQPDMDVDIDVEEDPEMEKMEEKEEWSTEKDLDVQIEDPELQDPNATFDENLEEDTKSYE